MPFTEPEDAFAQEVTTLGQSTPFIALLVAWSQEQGRGLRWRLLNVGLRQRRVASKAKRRILLRVNPFANSLGVGQAQH